MSSLFFFGEAHRYITYGNEKSKHAHDALQSIDLPRLALNMKKVCEYLIEHKNFLDQLPNILDKILPTDYVVTPSALSFADWNTGNFANALIKLFF